ncbi:MAG TPA: AAA family ATPase [Ilumatobacter sp.]|nr:AAA family ATPase [Ilumatobacter sp.]
MAIVFITGMSATGKSTVLAELARRGHRVVDTDDAGWTLDAIDADGQPDRRWDPGRMAALIGSHTGTGNLFISGCVSNQGDFYGDFDAVVLLSCPEAVMLQRLAGRDTNPFGKSDDDRQRVLDDLAVVEPLLRRRATAEIDTRAPVEQVADAILRVT